LQEHQIWIRCRTESFYHGPVGTINYFAAECPGLTFELKIFMTSIAKEIRDSAVVVELLHVCPAASWTVYLAPNPPLAQNPGFLERALVRNRQVCFER
jgi:hypothetical protein